MIRSSLIPLALGLTLAFAGSMVSAAPVTITQGNPDTLKYIDVRAGDANGTMPAVVRNARDTTFRAALDAGSPITEEGFTTVPYDVSIDSFGGATANPLVAPTSVLGGIGSLTPLTGSSFVDTNLSSMAGRFNTTLGQATCSDPDPFDEAGVEACTSRWFESAGSFEIDFGGAFGAFGFFGTDFGDFAGTLTLDLLGGAGAAQIVLSEFAGSDGAAMFFGFYDLENQYSGVRFTVNQAGGSDYFGFDDLLLGQTASDPGTPVPEPGSLALVGASLLALAATRRRRKA